MSGPFVYVPEASSTPPHNLYYATPLGGPSPFLPPVALYPASPFLGSPTALGPSHGSPSFNANSVLWPEDAPPYESAYTASWAPLSTRQRTTSWHGPAPPPTSPFLQPAAAPAFTHSQSAYFTPGHKRSVSWGAAGAPPPPPWLTNANSYTAIAPPALEQIHPWLNGDAPSPIFHFDLAPGQFAPVRMASANPPQSAGLSAAEISEPAFHPPRTALRILHPRIPFWPVDLVLPEVLAAEPPMPISFGDVLVALHRAMHQRISHADWATLSAEDERVVTHAFAQRCRAEAVRSGVPPAHLRDREVAERNQGVKRVDFLLGKTVFKGLVRWPGDPEGCVRMVTA
ncbi:hypothetical protein B0H15DRAFT_1024944 [Mycena belliarum]|uniref:DUF6699 domain-containing protein n=1 Tax=Mycena belliarum TaxID=1033014 RepID=A0AAD6U129_9AGAR|nr:hypothetical protein B0H15DRAFT_1024944 [Mycena belliae]